MKKNVCLLAAILLLSFYGALYGQSTNSFEGKVNFADLSFFQPTGENWQVVGEVSADLEKGRVLYTKSGEGILVNLPDDDHGTNIMSKMEHGDIDLEFEFMMAKRSNSGVYLQGRYEVQLFDSWGKENPTYQDCGAIYGRWDESRPEGYKSYEGHAPRMNASIAPGLWQKMYISFQAPRFDANGNKVEHARIIKVELNGTVIHENVTLTGPTRGSAFEGEAPKGPLFIQGDHGPVAFRNISYKLYEPQEAVLSNIQYQLYQGKFNEWPDLSTLTPAYSGEMESLTQEVVKEKAKFLLRTKATLEVPTSGEYEFQLVTLGQGAIMVDGNLLGEPVFNESVQQVELSAGTHELEILYHKPVPWYDNGLGLFISGPGLRIQALHNLGSIPLGNPTNPIFVDLGAKPKILRSFMDYQGEEFSPSRRIVHAISVGFPQGYSYTFDPDRASLVQIWKGNFLDATPMWNNRGDGSSDPRGTLLSLGDHANVGMLSEAKAAWMDTLAQEVGYRFKGYQLDSKGIPTFIYQMGETECHDKIMPAENGPYFTRSIKVSPASSANMYILVASGDEITSMEDGVYAIDQSYFIQLDEKGPGKPMLRNSDGKQELLMPLSSKDDETTFAYSIIW